MLVPVPHRKTCRRVAASSPGRMNKNKRVKSQMRDAIYLRAQAELCLEMARQIE